MNVRDLKLAIVCEYESEEVKSINAFFDGLFTGIKIYTKDDNPDLIFMKGDKLIMKQDLKNGYLDCRYDGFWLVLENQFGCTHKEIQEIIQYKVGNVFKMDSLTPDFVGLLTNSIIENAFECGKLTPIFISNVYMYKMIVFFKNNLLTPFIKKFI